MNDVIVLGIGQILRGDDAAGMTTVQEWAEWYPEWGAHPHVATAFSPLPGLALLDQISGYQVAILVDTVLGGPNVTPGALMYLVPEDLASYTRGTGSAHGWGVAETLELGRTLGREDLPDRIVILGIGGKQAGIGEDLSPEVAQAIPNAVETLNYLVQTALIEDEISLSEVS